MCRKLWPVYTCGHEQIPAQSTLTESCGNQCPEYSWGWGYYELLTDCGNVRCSTAIRRMLDKGQVKIADWKWNYGAHAGGSYGGGDAGPALGGMSYGADSNAGYGGGGYAGFAPMRPAGGPLTSCPVNGGYDSGPVMLPYPNGGSCCCQGYNNPQPMTRPMSAPPALFLGQPFYPSFPAFGGSEQGYPPPPPLLPTIVLRFHGKPSRGE